MNNRRGTMYEVPMLLVLFCIIIAIALPRAAQEPTTGRKVLVFAAASLGMLLVAAACLGLLMLLFRGIDLLGERRGRKRLARDLRDLKNPDVKIRRAAARDLREHWHDSKDGAPELTKALADPDTFVRFEAAEALARMGSNEDAASLLAKELPAADLPAVLSEVLRGPEQEHRYLAALIAGSEGARAAAAIPALAAALGDRKWRDRGVAAYALEEMGTAALPALPALIEALSDESEGAAYQAAKALAALGAAAAPAVPSLIAALGKTTLLRRWAIDALGKIGPVAAAAIPPLEGLATSASEFDRKIIAEALAAIRL